MRGNSAIVRGGDTHRLAVSGAAGHRRGEAVLGVRAAELGRLAHPVTRRERGRDRADLDLEVARGPLGPDPDRPDVREGL